MLVQTLRLNKQVNSEKKDEIIALLNFFESGLFLGDRL
jgi:hypothetical protein